MAQPVLPISCALAAATAATLIGPLPAAAASHHLEIASLVAAWHNPRAAHQNYLFPPRIVQGDGSETHSSVHWSTVIPGHGPTGFIFAPPAPHSVGLDDGNSVALGQLTIQNGVISAFGYLLEYVELSLDIHGHVGGDPARPFHLPLRYALTYEDTPNDSQTGCPDWQRSAIPCDDRATITAMTPTGLVLQDGDATLDFAVTGFHLDGLVRSAFILPEETETETTLMATLSVRRDPPAAIPLPAALPLLASGLGLVLLWGRRRRR